jgi:hypothetical protein
MLVNLEGGICIVDFGEVKPLEGYPLPRTRSVSGKWKSTPGGKPDYEVIDIDDLLEAHRLSIRPFVNKLIKRKEKYEDSKY